MELVPLESGVRLMTLCRFRLFINLCILLFYRLILFLRLMSNRIFFSVFAYVFYIARLTALNVMAMSTKMGGTMLAIRKTV